MRTFIFSVVAFGAVGGGMSSHELELNKQPTLINISLFYDCFEAETFVSLLAVG